MPIAGPMLPVKRRLEDTETNNLSAVGRTVIEISDESETSSQSPPAKRQKSHTPAEKTSHTFLPSRGRSTNAKSTSSSAATSASRATRPNGVNATGSAATHSLPKPLPRASTKQTQICDLTVDSESSPSPPTPPSRNPRNNGPSGRPLFDRVRTARHTNTHRSLYTGSPQNDVHRRRRDVSRSSSSTSSDRGWEKRRSDAGERTVDFSKNNALGKQIPTASQTSSLTDFTLEIPGKKTFNRQIGVSHQPIKQANFEVVVDSPNGLLQQFQRPLPTLKARLHAERKDTWSSLKQSPKLAYENLALVEKHFGQTGFSKAYSTEDEEELAFMRNAASKKKKQKVNRANINLEIGSLIQSVEDLNISKRLIHPAQTARDILTSRFDEKVNPPLTFSNDINSKRLHGKFQFIDHYIIGEKVKVAPPSTNQGCECSDCSLSSCLCFTKKVKDGQSKGTYNAQLKTYTRRPDGKVVLSDEFLERELDPSTEKYEITECNEFCGCGTRCWNRVVGNGRTVPLEIFQTEKCGFGVRSSHNIVRGQFIELYLGEVITESELLRRDDAENDDDPSYIHLLDWFGTIGNNTTYHVDGKYFGSAMRFVNHSCVPNARCFPVQIHKEDRRVYYLAFFAIKDIKAGVEIRINYHSEDTSLGSSQEDPDHQELNLSGQLSDGLSRCYCGEKSCRGIIWQPGVKTRRRRRQGD